MTPNLETPQARAARVYMEHKGYATAQPWDVVGVDGDTCWYFYYDLPDGELELEVAWEDGEWRYKVTSFVPPGASPPP